MIEAIKGKRIRGYTEYENENEIMLLFGTQFRVKSDPLERPSGTFTVHLIQINDEDDKNQQSLTLAMKTNLPNADASGKAFM